MTSFFVCLFFSFELFCDKTDNQEWSERNKKKILCNLFQRFIFGKLNEQTESKKIYKIIAIDRLDFNENFFFCAASFEIKIFVDKKCR